MSVIVWSKLFMSWFVLCNKALLRWTLTFSGQYQKTEARSQECWRLRVWPKTESPVPTSVHAPFFRSCRTYWPIRVYIIYNKKLYSAISEFSHQACIVILILIYIVIFQFFLFIKFAKKFWNSIFTLSLWVTEYSIMWWKKHLNDCSTRLQVRGSEYFLNAL